MHLNDVVHRNKNVGEERVHRLALAVVGRMERVPLPKPVQQTHCQHRHLSGLCSSEARPSPHDDRVDEAQLGLVLQEGAGPGLVLLGAGTVCGDLGLQAVALLRLRGELFLCLLLYLLQCLLSLRDLGLVLGVLLPQAGQVGDGHGDPIAQALPLQLFALQLFGQLVAAVFGLSQLLARLLQLNTLLVELGLQRCVVPWAWAGRLLFVVFALQIGHLNLQLLVGGLQQSDLRLCFLQLLEVLVRVHARGCVTGPPPWRPVMPGHSRHLVRVLLRMDIVLVV
mmetsp:Transcript_74466/g.131594  ORF Transcript_74466/g.131594 Transcript_74466/m.131594 type:complete len:281 (+) Transcript_74466:1234-2076(+)